MMQGRFAVLPYTFEIHCASNIMNIYIYIYIYVYLNRITELQPSRKTSFLIHHLYIMMGYGNVTAPSVGL